MSYTISDVILIKFSEISTSSIFDDLQKRLHTITRHDCEFIENGIEWVKIVRVNRIQTHRPTLFELKFSVDDFLKSLGLSEWIEAGKLRVHIDTGIIFETASVSLEVEDSKSVRNLVSFYPNGLE